MTTYTKTELSNIFDNFINSNFTLWLPKRTDTQYILILITTPAWLRAWLGDCVKAGLADIADVKPYCLVTREHELVLNFEDKDEFIAFLTQPK